MQLRSSLKALPTFIFLLSLQHLSLISSSNFITENKLLYNSSTSYLSPTQFVISFPSAFSITPYVCYGINHYQMGDRFYYENVLTLINLIQKTRFLIGAYPVGSTFVYKLSINYLAMNGTNNFVTLSRSYPNPPIVSALSGNRSVTLYESYNFSSASVSASLFLTGFYVQSINMFHLQVAVSNFSLFGFQLHVTTTSNCKINRIDLSYLFYYVDKVADEYVVRSGIGFCFRNMTGNSFTVQLSNGKSVVMLGMSGFAGNTINSKINFGWEVNKSTANQLMVTFNTADLFYLCYNIIQISPVSTVSQPQTKPEAGKDYTIIIIISICAVFASVLIVCCLVRCCKMRSKHYQLERVKQTKKRLSVATLNELPSLHF